MAACKVAHIHTALPTADKTLLNTWLTTSKDPTGRLVSAPAMSEALHLEGHPVSPTTLKDHRGRRCGCYRKATTDAQERV